MRQRWRRRELAQTARIVDECFALYRMVETHKIARERASVADPEMLGRLMELGYPRADTEIAVRATGGTLDFDLRLRRALRVLRGG